MDKAQQEVEKDQAEGDGGNADGDSKGKREQIQQEQHDEDEEKEFQLLEAVAAVQDKLNSLEEEEAQQVYPLSPCVLTYWDTHFVQAACVGLSNQALSVCHDS